MEDIGEGTAPAEGFEAVDHIDRGPLGDGTPRPSTTARVAFADKVAWLVLAGTRGASVAKARRDGWIEVDVPTDDAEGLVSWVLSYGPDARALAPKTLRDEVVRRLEVLEEGVPA